MIVDDDDDCFNSGYCVTIEDIGFIEAGGLKSKNLDKLLLRKKKE